MAVVNTSSHLTTELRKAAHFLVSEFDIKAPTVDELDNIKKPRRGRPSPDLPQAHLLSQDEIVDLLVKLPITSTTKHLVKTARRHVSGLPKELVVEWAYVRGHIVLAEANKDELDGSRKPDLDSPNVASSHVYSSINSPSSTSSSGEGPPFSEHSEDSPVAPSLPKLTSDLQVPLEHAVSSTDDNERGASNDEHRLSRSFSVDVLQSHDLALRCPSLLDDSAAHAPGDHLVLESNSLSTDNSSEQDPVTRYRPGALAPPAGGMESGREACRADESVERAVLEGSENEAIGSGGSEMRENPSVGMVLVGVKDVGVADEQKATGSGLVVHRPDKRARDDEDTDDSHQRARHAPPTGGFFSSWKGFLSAGYLA